MNNHFWSWLEKSVLYQFQLVRGWQVYTLYLLVFKWIFIVYSRNIELKTPFEVERSSDEKHFTYLDTVGRPVVVAKKSDLVENHIQDFEVTMNT